MPLTSPSPDLLLHPHEADDGREISLGRCWLAIFRSIPTSGMGAIGSVMGTNPRHIGTALFHSFAQSRAPAPPDLTQQIHSLPGSKRPTWAEAAPAAMMMAGVVDALWSFDRFFDEVMQ
jgi:hypothetical protein